MIHDVAIFPLRRIIDKKGEVLHMLRSDSTHFEKFGEIYFSVVYKHAIKAWKLHRRMTLNLTVPFGKVKLVLYDNRKESPTKGNIQELIIGKQNYCLVKIPPMIWSGFQGLSKAESIIANCATLPHDPEEVERLDPSDSSIPYDWYLQNS